MVCGFCSTGCGLNIHLKDGVAIGLTPTAEGTRVTWSGGNLTYTDGPFTESKEVVGGYAILQAKDKAEALEWTKRFLQTHPNSWNVTAEVRQIAEM